MLARIATLDDAPAIARIYNQAIEERASTFETQARSAGEVRAWFDGAHPVIVVESDRQVVGYGATSAYSSRECYRGIAEFSVYVDRDHRRQGVGRLALTALYDAARKAGLWKLVSRIFPENTAVRDLNRALGIREIGVHEKHARLDGAWRDVIVVEWLIRQNFE